MNNCFPRNFGSLSPVHGFGDQSQYSILTPGQPVPALFRYCQVHSVAVSRLPFYKVYSLTLLCLKAGVIDLSATGVYNDNRKIIATRI